MSTVCECRSCGKQYRVGPHRAGITVGPPGCPVIVSGRQVWDKHKQTITVELHVPGHDGPIWRDSLDAMSSRTFHEQITDETVRNSMLETLGWQVSDLNFPYFIPQSPELLALPVVLD